MTQPDHWKDTELQFPAGTSAGGAQPPAATAGAGESAQSKPDNPGTDQSSPLDADAARPDPAKTDSAPADFANTEMLQQEELDSRLWAEAVDGRCSERASLFAASQSAPLNVV